MTREERLHTLRAQMHTEYGGTCMIDMLTGDPLPRIC